MIYAIIRALVPVSPRKIVFHSYPEMDDNALALFVSSSWSRAKAKYQLIWLVDDVNSARAKLSRHTIHHNLKFDVVRKNSIAGILNYLSAAYVFTTHGTFSFARYAGPQKIINLWHGMPLKRIGLTDGKAANEVQFCTHTVATSDFFQAAMAEAFGLPLEKVLLSGQPRNEWLLEPVDWREALKVGPSHSLAVWMPTYRKSAVGDIRSDSTSGDGVTTELLSAVDVALNDTGIYLVVKFHPMDVLNKLVWPSFRNVKVYTQDDWQDTGINMYNFLGASDRLITDFSSVGIDYLTLRRPVAMFVPDLEHYSRGFTPGALELCLATCARLNNVQDLIRFLRGDLASLVDDSAFDRLNAPTVTSPSESILTALDLV